MEYGGKKFIISDESLLSREICLKKFSAVDLYTVQFKFLQDKAENFVMAALFCASEEGNVEGLKELMNMAQNIDLNTANRVRNLLCIVIEVLS